MTMVMTMRNAMVTAWHWAALSGALAMVGFLTFLPQGAGVPDHADRITHHSSPVEWPSRTAEKTAALR